MVVRAVLQNKSAFSLIELMVVVAIVALISSVAIPSYKGYLKRTKIATLKNIVQKTMADYADAVISKSTITSASGPIGDYIHTIVFDGNSISVTINNPSNIDPVLDGAVVEYSPSVSSKDGILTWSCTVLSAGHTTSLSYSGTSSTPLPSYNDTIVSSWQTSGGVFYYKHHFSWNVPGPVSTLGSNLVC